MKYGLSLDQKKLHGSYQIVYQQKMAIPIYKLCIMQCVWIAIFSPRSWNNSMVGVINFNALADDWSARPNQPQHRLCSVSCTGKGQVASQRACVFVESTQR